MKELGFRLRGLRKLNFGCGSDKRKGYLNIDLDPTVKPDLLIVDNDYSMLPLNHYNEILANDVLEHITRTKTFETLMQWATYLRLGGKLSMQTTSVLDIASNLKKQKTYAGQQVWLMGLFGNQQHVGDYHHTGFTEANLRVYLISAGFTVNSIDLRDGWLFCVEAQKTSDWFNDLKNVVTASKKVSDEVFLKQAYQKFLGRDIDKVGLKHNLNALAVGTNRLDILKSVLTSPERLEYVAAQNKL